MKILWHERHSWTLHVLPSISTGFFQDRGPFLGLPLSVD